MKTMLVFLFVGVLTLPVSGFQKDIASNESKGARLKGKILDSRDKEMGIAGSNITIVGTELGGSSMPDGFYMITNVPPGSWNVKVQHLSYALQEKTISVKGDEVIVLDFELKRKDQGEVFTAQKMEQDPKDTAIYFVTAEEMAEPIGGIMAIQKNVYYPELMKKAGIQGTVRVEVFIDETGNVVRTAIAKGIHPGLDKAASDAVAKTKFKPAKQRGKTIKARLSIPIRFRLNSEDQTQKHKLYPGNYELRGGGIEVPEKAEWKAINTEIEKDKVLLVLQEKWDNQNGFWSVMSYLTKEEAKKLAEELQKAAEKIK